MKHLVPGYWECTCCLNAFVALYGSLLQATYVGSWWAGETPWKQRGLSMAFPFSRKVFGTLMGLASILKNLSCDEILRLHACSVNWEGTLLSQLLFSLIAVLKFVLKGKPFGIFLCSHLHEVIRVIILSIWICSDFISCAFKKVSRASFNSRSSSSFMCILLSCWVHVPPVFISSQIAPQPMSEASVCKTAWPGRWVEVFPLYISMFFNHQRSSNWNLLFSNTWRSKTTMEFCWGNGQNCLCQVT